MHDIPSAVSEQASVGNSKMKGHYVRTLRTSPTKPTSAPPRSMRTTRPGPRRAGRGADRCRARMLRHSLKDLPRAMPFPPVRPGPTSPLAMPQRSPDSIVDRDEGIQCRKWSN
ncbi:hypothetical protein EDB83DRAFT_2316010 [Lactarius deliciosus]|nr:hypothetical protein EDB83DRAFT_2316010 [Lactarius deliciosus]